MRLARLMAVAALGLALSATTARADDFSTIYVTKVEKVGDVWKVTLHADLTTTDNPMQPWEVVTEDSIQMPLNWDTIAWTPVAGQANTYELNTVLTITESGTYYFRLWKTPVRGAWTPGDVTPHVDIGIE